MSSIRSLTRAAIVTTAGAAMLGGVVFWRITSPPRPECWGMAKFVASAHQAEIVKETQDGNAPPRCE